MKVFRMEETQESEVEKWVRCLPGLGQRRGAPGGGLGMCKGMEV